jgi:uncharacterized protein YprB with RNaseH-like and TPR domain
MKTLKDTLHELSRAHSASQNSESSNSPVKDQLKRLYPDRKIVKHFPDTRLQQQSSGLEDRVGGLWINTSFGDIFRAEFTWELKDLYGNCDLSTIFSIEPHIFSETFVTPQPGTYESLLFLDTETTGLSGGSGTVAFMIGLGFIRENVFHVHQYFISRLSHEEGMLELVQSVVNQYDTIISYNGKTFDIPLLNTRFLMNHLQPLNPSFPHIDLLHHSRNLWKYSQENCKLTTLERDKLGFEREEDIPGELIPGVYFEYMRLNRIDMLAQVFIHNRWDIITMLAVLIMIVKTHAQRDAEFNPLDDYAKGRLFRNRQDFERSIAHYRYVLSSPLSKQRRLKTLLELGAVLKKCGESGDAVKIWREALDPELPFCYEAYRELSVYYEHRQKDLMKALTTVCEALERIPSHRQDEILALEKRKKRLEHKISSGKNE